MTDRVGQQLGNYRLTQLLGQGAFAEVYLGEHTLLETTVAVKVLHTQMTQDDVARFRQEARLLASLKHPHIVRLFDFGIEGQTPYLVMDYAPNGTLRTRHAKGLQLPVPTVVGYVKQIAEALQYAHDRKVIHRDIKPENMLIDERGEILLSDFGIALIAQSSRYQSTKDMAGTIAYMAPEQISAHPRPASDQYSLGIVAYEWLCGTQPFHGSYAEIAIKHTVTPPPPLRRYLPTLSPDVEYVISTALAKQPEERFASVSAFATVLEQASQNILPTKQSHPPSTPSSVLTSPPPLADSLLPTTIPATPLPIPLARSARGVRKSSGLDIPLIVSAVLFLVIISSSVVWGAVTVNKTILTNNANATATAAANPDPYPPSGTLAWLDSLSQQGKWHTEGACQFIGGVYQITAQEKGYFESCDDRETLSNFAFEVKMRIKQGDSGGLEIRGEGSDFYLFVVSQEGSYSFIKYTSNSSATTLGSSGPNSAANDQGTGQLNVIAVVAKDSNFDFYVNSQKIGTVVDSTYSQGYIGLIANASYNTTTVTYQDAKLWTI